MPRANPVRSLPARCLHNGPPTDLIERIKIDIDFVATGRRVRRYWRVAILKIPTAAMMPADFDDLIDFDKSKPAAIAAANTDAAFMMLVMFDQHAELLRVALAIILWLSRARRTSLNVAASYLRKDQNLDANILVFLGKRRAAKFKTEMRL